MCIISCDFFSTAIIQGVHKSLLSGLSTNLKIWSHRSQGLNESLFGLGWSLLIQCDTIPRRQHVQLIVHVLPIYFFSYIWQMHHHTLCVRIMGGKKNKEEHFVSIDAWTLSGMDSFMDPETQIQLHCITVISGKHDSSVEINLLMRAQIRTVLGRIALGDDAIGAVLRVGQPVNICIRRQVDGD